MVKIWPKYTHPRLEETKLVSLGYAVRYKGLGTFVKLSLTLFTVEAAICGHHPSEEELVDL